MASGPTAEIPPALRTPEFETAWADFLAHRAELRHPRCPLTDTSARLLLKKLLAFGPRRAAEMLETAIANSWRGVVFPDKHKPGKSSDQLDREQRNLKREQSAKLAQRQSEQNDVTRRAQVVRDLPGLERERLRKKVTAKAAPEFRRRMEAADPCSGGMLAMLIYAEMEIEKGAA